MLSAGKPIDTFSAPCDGARHSLTWSRRCSTRRPGTAAFAIAIGDAIEEHRLTGLELLQRSAALAVAATPLASVLSADIQR